VGRFEFDSGVIEGSIANVLSETVVQLANGAHVGSRTTETPEKNQGSRASELLLNYLQSGVVHRFKQHFGNLTALSISAVRRALYKLGAEGLAIACKGAGIELDIFAEFLWRIHGGGRSNASFRTTEQYREAIIYFDNLKVEEARETLQVWKDVPPNPDA
jgi:hypothetical protein